MRYSAVVGVCLGAVLLGGLTLGLPNTCHAVAADVPATEPEEASAEAEAEEVPSADLVSEAAPTVPAASLETAPSAAEKTSSGSRLPVFFGLLAALFLLVSALAGAHDKPSSSPPV